MTVRGRTEVARAAEPRTPVWNPDRNPPVLSRAPLGRREPPPLADEDVPVEPRAARLRRRLAFGLVLVVLAMGVMVVGRLVRADGRDRLVVPEAPVAAASAHPVVRAAAAPRAGGSGAFAYVSGFGPVLGRGGRLHRFRVAVEKPTAGVVDFADTVNRVLGDRRSWTAGRRLRLQRVPESAPAEFVIYLASARTSERMCRTGGLETGAFTSCRVSGKVIINDDRWQGAIKGYGAPLATYRAYAINHEVGHQLGHGHERCPGRGRLAPVMMQQTYGLKGCRANAWPYPAP